MTWRLVTNPGEIGFCLSLRGSADKGKEVGGGDGGSSGPLYDLSSPCIYKLVTGSPFPLNNDDYLQINDIAVASVKKNSKKKLGFSGGHFNVRYLVTLAFTSPNLPKYNRLEFSLHFLAVFSILPFSDLFKLHLLEILPHVSVRQVSLAFLFG